MLIFIFQTISQKKQMMRMKLNLKNQKKFQKNAPDIEKLWPSGTTINAIEDGPFTFYRATFKIDDDFAILFWRFPPNFSSNNLKGIVLLFHGCTHDGDDWFRLCEDRKIISYLLSKNYLPIGLHSIQGRSGCWNVGMPASANPDAHRISKSLTEFFKAFNIKVEPKSNDLPPCSQIPIFIMGASSGGTFVTVFHYLFQVNGIIVHISPGSEEALSSAKQNHYPPVAFIYMPGDTFWASEANINAECSKLKEKNIPNTAYQILPFNLQFRNISK